MKKIFTVVCAFVCTYSYGDKKFFKQKQSAIDDQTIKDVGDHGAQHMTVDTDHSYAHRYADDIKNFVEESRQEIEGTASQDLVFLNFHGLASLAKPGGYVPGSRTLSWLTPYSCALQSGDFFKREDAHEKLALLKSWSHHALRNFVSFIIIPQGTKLRFHIGTASAQGKKKFIANGGGLQLRMHTLPKGTIVLTQPLIKNAEKPKQSFNVHALFSDAIEAYNQEHSAQPLAPTLLDPQVCLEEENFLSAAFKNIVALPK